MKKVILICLLVFSLFSCENQEKYEYVIIEEDKNKLLRKTNIEIRLEEEISKTDLERIAFQLKNNRKEYDRLWIFYYLPEHEVGKGAWATTHFKPELDVKILGAPIGEKERIASIKVSGEVIGSWQDNDPMLLNIKHLVREDGKLFIKTIYSKSELAGEGGEVKEEVFEKQLKNGVKRYDYDNIHGEYYLIELNGNLSLYDDSGKFKEAIKLK